MSIPRFGCAFVVLFAEAVSLVCSASAQDCNDNGILDECDLYCGEPGGPCDLPGCGQSQDCNWNGVPDECDIADGTSADCTNNGIPDECEPDCNSNGVADSCDIAGGSSADCNTDGIPDECEVGTTTITIPFSLDTDPGWMVQGLWAFGQPTGQGGENGGHDPTSGHTGTKVYGYNLTGDYENNLPERHLTSTPINCTGLHNVHLGFWRWLGVDQSARDHAYVRVSNDNSTWMTVWHNTAEVADTSWQWISLNISTWADNQPAVYLRWTMGTTDAYWRYCGWNIDDVQVSGTRIGGGEGDCNANQIPDDCDIASGVSQDCNSNQIPDECDIAAGITWDCNANAVPDECDIASGTSLDENSNGIPDECEAVVVYVNGTTGDDAQYNGFCEEWDGGQCGPKKTIQAGIDVSANGNTVRVAEGTYAGANNTDLDFSHGRPLGQTRAIRLLGAGGAEYCVIDCAQVEYGLRFHSQESALAVVDGFTIRDADQSAVYCEYDSSPSIVNCVIAGNGSGGVYGYNSSPTLTNCTIASNTGGGVFCSYSNPTLTNCTIASNTGGGVFCEGGRPILTTCTISGNNGSMYGGAGGVYCSGSPTLTNCTITGNTAGSGGGVRLGSEDVAVIDGCVISENFADTGGGVSCDGAGVHISGSIISNNVAYTDGGVSCSAAVATIVDSTFRANRTTGMWVGGSGGALGISNCSAFIGNCTFVGNMACEGGGIVCWQDFSNSVCVSNCTFTNNTALRGGGAISSWSGELTIENSILWADAAVDGPEIFLGGALAISFSDVAGGEDGMWNPDGNIVSWGPGNLNTDPLFALAERPHLLPSSPCVDAGTNDPTGGLLPEDPEGVARPWNGGVADMGAFEFVPAAPRIAISLDACRFRAGQEGPPADEQLLTIRNSGGGTLNWHIAPTETWLTAAPADGSSTGQSEMIALNVNAAGMAPGVYTCMLTITAPGAVNDPRTIPVVLELGRTLHVDRDQYYWLIDQALYDAQDGDFVLVADGSYSYECLDFGGKRVTVQSENGPQSCTITDSDSIRFDESETPDSVLSGFTLQEPWTVVYCESSSPTIRNCVISGSTTAAVQGGSPTLDGCLITGNSGFAVQCWGLTMTGCTVTDNVAVSGDGGGIYATGGRLWIRDSTIAGNRQFAFGSYQPSVVCSALLIENSVVDNNVGGGLSVSQYGGYALINACTISANTGLDTGWGVGGIYADSARIVNCVIAHNAAAEPGGGGIRCSGAATIANCTIADNTSQWNGGGLLLGPLPSTLVNSVLWGNQAANCGPQIALELGAGVLTVAHSDVAGGSDAVCDPGGVLQWGPGNVDDGPRFVNAIEVDYHLLAGSPCIDAGDNAAVRPESMTDINGWTRIVDGDGDGFAIVDMGAHEARLGDLNGDGVVGIDDVNLFAACLAGPEVPPPPDCDGADLDADGDVDLSDFARLQSLFGQSP